MHARTGLVTPTAYPTGAPSRELYALGVVWLSTKALGWRWNGSTSKYLYVHLLYVTIAETLCRGLSSSGRP
jgi:hypothetical protein